MPRKQRIRGVSLTNRWIEIQLERMWIASELLNKYEEEGNMLSASRSSYPVITQTNSRVTFRKWFARQELQFACVLVCPTFGWYAKIRANVGDPDQDCGKIVTMERISGFGRNPSRVWKAVPASRRHSQNLHVSTFANLHCGLCPANSYGFHVNQQPPPLLLCPQWISILQDLTFWRPSLTEVQLQVALQLCQGLTSIR